MKRIEGKVIFMKRKRKVRVLYFCKFKDTANYPLVSYRNKTSERSKCSMKRVQLSYACATNLLLFIIHHLKQII